MRFTARSRLRVAALAVASSVFVAGACTDSSLSKAEITTTSRTPVASSTSIETAATTTTTALPDQPTVVPKRETIYYDISGASDSELRAQMDQLGPVDDLGERYDALTRWDFQWRWPGGGPEGCRLSAVRITYSISVTLPRWSAPPDAAPELVRRWETYLGAVTAHEEGHVALVVDNVAALTSAIEAATCETANDAAGSVMTAINQANIAYDVRTDHGATQGASFP
jgi:predicted secreted Zn-dependent protease